MGYKKYSATTKLDAKALRDDGKTYKEIREALGIPKSTLSEWFGQPLDTAFGTPEWHAHLVRARELSRVALQKRTEERSQRIQEKVAGEIEDMPLAHKNVKKALLAMLYWSEGSKSSQSSGPRFANTDPELICLYLSLLRECYSIEEEKIRVRIHVHYYHKKNEVQKFWADKMDISPSQITAIFTKKRSKTRRFRKNYMGICYVAYPGVTIREELMTMAYSIGSWYNNPTMELRS